MRNILVTCALLCLALATPVALADDDTTYAPTPSEDGEGDYPCVVIDWNHLVVGIRENCWSP